MTILSIPLMQHLVLLALKPEFQKNELYCLLTCDQGVNYFFITMQSIAELVFTFILEWLFARTRYFEAVARDSADELVKIFYISTISFLGLYFYN